jgi:hypothetical protein
MTASKQRKQRLADLIRRVRLEGDAEAAEDHIGCSSRGSLV